MSTYIEYIVILLFIVASSILFSVLGFIVSIVVVFKILSYRVPVDVPYVSIRDTWELSDRAHVPRDMYRQYREYLMSTEWKAIRLLALKRDMHRCTICGYIGNRLQVHHTSYDGIYNMTFTLDQLQTVCDLCHEDLHRS